MCAGAGGSCRPDLCDAAADKEGRGITVNVRQNISTVHKQPVDSRHFLPAAYPASHSAESAGSEDLDCRESED